MSGAPAAPRTPALRPRPRSTPPTIRRIRLRRCPRRAGRRVRTGSSRRRRRAARAPASAHPARGRKSAPPPSPSGPSTPVRGRCLRAVSPSVRPCRSPSARRPCWRLAAGRGPLRLPTAAPDPRTAPPGPDRCRTRGPARTPSARESCSAPPGPGSRSSTDRGGYRYAETRASGPPSRPAAEPPVAGNRCLWGVSLLTRYQESGRAIVLCARATM